MARYRRSYQRRPPQKTTWYSGWLEKSITGINDKNVHTFLLGTQTFPFDHECTLMRTRGTLAVLGQGNDPNQLTFGGIVVDKMLASNLTDANVPNIMTEEDGDDYFVYQTFACVPQQLLSIDVDSKAKRRFEQGKAIAWVGAYRNIGGGVINSNLVIGLNYRLLFKFN